MENKRLKGAEYKAARFINQLAKLDEGQVYTYPDSFIGTRYMALKLNKHAVFNLVPNTIYTIKVTTGLTRLTDSSIGTAFSNLLNKYSADSAPLARTAPYTDEEGTACIDFIGESNEVIARINEVYYKSAVEEGADTFKLSNNIVFGLDKAGKVMALIALMRIK